MRLYKPTATAASSFAAVTVTQSTTQPPVTQPTSYSVSIAAMLNGTVTASRSSATSGTYITLTVTPASGYELDAIRVYRTGSSATLVTVNGTGNSRSFSMPAYNVTVAATFRKTQAQLDNEAVNAAKVAIEGGTYRVAQATANEQTSVKTWQENTLHVLFNQTHGVTIRAAAFPVEASVTVTQLTHAIAGTLNAPNGANESFRSSVTLTRGSATATALVTNGVIVATPHGSTTVKRIEMLNYQLTIRILNTGNAATGELTLALSGANASVFSLPQATVNSLAVGGEADIMLVPRADLAKGTYIATLTASGESVAPVSVNITYTITDIGNDNPQSNALISYV